VYLIAQKALTKSFVLIHLVYVDSRRNNRPNDESFRAVIC